MVLLCTTYWNITLPLTSVKVDRPFQLYSTILWHHFHRLYPFILSSAHSFYKVLNDSFGALSKFSKIKYSTVQTKASGKISACAHVPFCLFLQIVPPSYHEQKEKGSWPWGYACRSTLHPVFAARVVNKRWQGHLTCDKCRNAILTILPSHLEQRLKHKAYCIYGNNGELVVGSAILWG